jgi:hypothetical protein
MQLLMRRPETDGFISVSPPTNAYDFSFLAPCPASGLFLHGSNDGVATPQEVERVVAKLRTQKGISIAYELVDGASHYWTDHLQEVEDRVGHYLDVLADKTGSLVATSARFGAAFAGAPPALVAALTAFGEEVGVAFQLSDDLLDIVSEQGDSGKAPGTDLREGIATLPVLFALAGDDPAEGRLRELVTAPVTDPAEHAEALALLRSSASLDRATEVLRQYAERARGRLAAVPPGEVRDALSALCDYVVTRSA